MYVILKGNQQADQKCDQNKKENLKSCLTDFEVLYSFTVHINVRL